MTLELRIASPCEESWENMKGDSEQSWFTKLFEQRFIDARETLRDTMIMLPPKP